jgi:Cu+-exporting ATPase
MTTLAAQHEGTLPVADGCCRHCGEPCALTAVDTTFGRFCCRGCASVFALIAEHGLGRFYVCDVVPGRSQRDADQRHPDRFAALDDPAIAARFAAPAGDVRVATLAVPAMHCASCLWLLEQLWRLDAGIRRSEANLHARTVTVAFDPAAITLRGIAELLAALGYEPVLDPEPPRRVPSARRQLYLRIGVAGFAFGNVMLFSVPRYLNGAPLEPAFDTLFGWLNIAFAVPVLAFSAKPYFAGAWASLRARAITLDVPIALGLAVMLLRSVAEIVTHTGEGFLDSLAGLVFFLLIGRLFQEKAFDRLSFDRTMRSFLPLSVRVLRDEALVVTPVADLRPGDEIVLRPGEIVPADAIVADAHAAVDFAFVTGEAAPVALERGDAVMAGGRVSVRSTRLTVTHRASTSRLADLWSHPVFAAPKAHELTRVLLRFGRAFTIAALALAGVGAWLYWPDARMSAEVATAVLIVACPCALTLAAPIALGTAMGVLSRAGCFVKAPETVLDLARVTDVTFDKTGTLTGGGQAPRVTHALPLCAWRRVEALAAESLHPMSRALAGTSARTAVARDVEEVPGQGLSGVVEGKRVAIGRAEFVARALALPVPAVPRHASGVWAGVDGGAVTFVSVQAAERPGVRDALQTIAASRGVSLLSGDHARAGAEWESSFGAAMAFGQSPEDKLADVRARQAQGRRVAMVGDGLNDAAALAAADVGIAVSDDTACLVPACDAVIRGDRLDALPRFLDYAARARRVVALCFVVSLAYNTLGLGFALAGRLTPLSTAILMPISSLTIVALSAGLMRLRTREVLA